MHLEDAMSDWTDGLAGALGVAPLHATQEIALLDAARSIAHRLERKDTPLSSYLLGVATGARIAAGAPPEQAFAESLEALTSLLPADAP